MPDPTERLIQHSVPVCPLCSNGPHDYALLVKRSSPATLVFGGVGSEVEIGLRCPRTGGVFSSKLSLANNEEFVRVVEPGSADAADAGNFGGPAVAAESDTGPATMAPPPEAGDFADWVKTSRATALDFAKAMLTASSAAIPVYFAVLKYLGAEKVSDGLVGALSVLPPALFLLAVALFAATLRPRLAAVTAEEFPEFRAARLREIDRYLTAALTVFLLALLLSFVVFAVSLLA